MKTRLIKTLSGLLPFDPDTEAWYKKIKLGGIVENDSAVIRNPKFFRKYFALLRVGFDNWEPPYIESQKTKPMKNFDYFRGRIAILCGYYEEAIDFDGKTQFIPDSISFAKMKEPEFQNLYSNTIDIFLKNIYKQNITAEELDETVNRYLSFT